jgi:quinolinate synthase
MLRNNLVSHVNNIDAYVVDVNDIFKAYDIIKPAHIYLDKNDTHNKAIKLFKQDIILQSGNCTIHDNDSAFCHITDIKIYYNQNLKRNNTLAIIFDSYSDDNLLQKLDADSIPYHIFDSPHILHKYNLGLLTDNEKAHIMNTYRGIITPHKAYIAESKICNCPHYDMLDPDSIINNKLQNFNDAVIDINEYIKNNLYE